MWGGSILALWKMLWGKSMSSIAAYRKSVAAKPDVFESNLNLGLQLAKTGQPDAENFLRAATHLKPTSHVAEGQYRAWLALAQTIEKSKPEEALAPTSRPQRFNPRRLSRIFLPASFSKQENKFAEAEHEYKQALALDPQSSDAVDRAGQYLHARAALSRGGRLSAEVAWRHMQTRRRFTSSWDECWRPRARMDAAVAELAGGHQTGAGG